MILGKTGSEIYENFSVVGENGVLISDIDR